MEVLYNQLGLLELNVSIMKLCGALNECFFISLKGEVLDVIFW